MTALFIRPVLMEGKLWATAGSGAFSAFATWDDWSLTDLVDAKTIFDNWALLFAHVNGNLNGTDIDLAAAARSEAAMLEDIETMADTLEWPMVGNRHSHNGVDSAFLFAGIVQHSRIPDDAFAIFRSPTNDYRGLIMFGEIPWSRTVASSLVRYPYDSYRWRYPFATPTQGDNLHRGIDVAAYHGSTRQIMQLEVPAITTMAESDRESFRTPRTVFVVASGANVTSGEIKLLVFNDFKETVTIMWGALANV